MIPIKNKGMFLEEVLNITNKKYIDNNICVVSKIPTNIKLIKTNNENIIDKAKFESGENCDYIGCYNGIYFEFDAKETSKKEFKQQSIRKNQILKLNNVVKNKGYAFLIIYFSYYDRYFLVDWNLISKYFIDNKKTIPFEWFELNCIELFINNHLMLDYISKINLLTIN